jgi:hypothetical protein
MRDKTMLMLVDSELVILDGKCRSEIQIEVDKAKKRLESVATFDGVPEKFHKILSLLVQEAERNGKLRYASMSIHGCDVCGAYGGYVKRKRASRYHNKGEPDYSKPIYLYGFEYSDSAVHVRGVPVVGCCSECDKELRQYTPKILVGIQAEIPEALTGIPPRWKKFDNRHCAKCGWTGHEGQMLLLPALMGGKYHGECPQCHAQNLPFGDHNVKIADGFQIVPVMQM